MDSRYWNSLADFLCSHAGMDCKERCMDCSEFGTFMEHSLVKRTSDEIFVSKASCGIGKLFGIYVFDSSGNLRIFWIFWADREHSGKSYPCNDFELYDYICPGSRVPSADSKKEQ